MVFLKHCKIYLIILFMTIRVTVPAKTTRTIKNYNDCKKEISPVYEACQNHVSPEYKNYKDAELFAHCAFELLELSELKKNGKLYTIEYMEYLNKLIRGSEKTVPVAVFCKNYAYREKISQGFDVNKSKKKCLSDLKPLSNSPFKERTYAPFLRAKIANFPGDDKPTFAEYTLGFRYCKHVEETADFKGLSNSDNPDLFCKQNCIDVINAAFGISIGTSEKDVADRYENVKAYAVYAYDHINYHSLKDFGKKYIDFLVGNIDRGYIKGVIQFCEEKYLDKNNITECVRTLGRMGFDKRQVFKLSNPVKVAFQLNKKPGTIEDSIKCVQFYLQHIKDSADYTKLTNGVGGGYFPKDFCRKINE